MHSLFLILEATAHGVVFAKWRLFVFQFTVLATTPGEGVCVRMCAHILSSFAQ